MDIAAYKIDRFKLICKRSGIHDADPVGEDVNFMLNRKIIAGVGKTNDHSLSHRMLCRSACQFNWNDCNLSDSVDRITSTLHGRSKTSMV